MTDQTQPTQTTENMMQTLADEIRRKTFAQELNVFDEGDNFEDMQPGLVAIPEGRKIEDLTPHFIEAAELLRPLRRKGTATVTALESLIDWSNRFKGDFSALFAQPERTAPSLTCVANYHAGGPPGDCQRDDRASYNDHRAVYNFPLSKDWKFWMQLSDKWLDQAEFSTVIEDRIADFIHPSPAILDLKDGTADVEPWEQGLIELARKILGRFGQPHQLVNLGREIDIQEKSTLAVKRNPDTGEAQISFHNTQTDTAGQPLNIPTLYLIAIPVFDRGDLFRLAVRLKYRKSGGAVSFNLAPHNPDLAFDNALTEALLEAKEKTALPLIYGTPEI